MEKDRLDRTWELLDSYETPKVSGDFTPSLMRKVRADLPEARAAGLWGDSPSRRFAWRLASAMAACLAVVFTLGILWHRSWEHDADKTALPHSGGTTRTVADEQLIKDLEVYENIELLQNLELLADLDVVEKLDESSL